MKIILLMIGLLGCQTVKLNPDNNLSAIESNYQSIESKCGPHQRVGNNGCFISKDPIQVRTIQQGKIFVKSAACDVNWSDDYDDSEFISIPIKKDATKPCLYSIYMTPAYDVPVKDTEIVSGFFGDILVVPQLDDKPTIIESVTGEWYGVLPIQIEKDSLLAQLQLQAVIHTGSEMGFYNFTGCGASDIDAYETDIAYQMAPRNCIYHGAVIPLDGNPDLSFAIMVNVYDGYFKKLMTPIMTFDDDYIKLQFEPEVSFVEVNNKTYNDYRVDIDKDSDQVEVRAYTVKGRYIYGVYKNEIWDWQN